MASALRFSILKLLLSEVIVAATPTHRHYEGHVLDSVEVLPRGTLENHHAAEEEDASLSDMDHAENSSNSMVRAETHGPPKVHPNAETWKRITQAWIYNAIRHSRMFGPVLPALMAWASRVTSSIRPPMPMSLAVAGSAVWSYLACAWDDDDQEEFGKKVVGGCFMGACLAFFTLCFVASVMCGGCCLDSMITKTVPVGLAAAFFSLLSMMAPWASAMWACDSFDDEICSSCAKAGMVPCTKADRNMLKEACKSAAVAIGYITAYGWVAAIIAWVGFGMGMCMVCGCCNCKLGEEIAKRNGKGPGGKPPVGQPVR